MEINKFKAELTIPVEQYGNIKPTVEGTVEQIVDVYFEFSRMVKPHEGLPMKEWNAAVDEFNNTGTLKNGTELYEKMSTMQKFFFQEQKKSLKRLKAIEE